MAFIKGMDRNQKMMFPEYIDDYIDSNNPVRVIDAYVDTIDFKELGFTKSEEYRKGASGYYPGDVMKLYLYGYTHATRSSRRLERETYVNIEVIWLLRGLKPDFKTIADFRKENKEQIEKIFKDFTLLCKQLNLFGEKLIAVDGTKIKASNSKRNNFSEKKIKRQLKYIEEKTKEYFDMLENNDKIEASNHRYSTEEIQKKINILKERKENYESMQNKLAESEENEISTVDPDSRLMDNKNNGTEVSYNIQIAVD